MASQRDGVLAAMVAALSAGTPPATVARFRTLPVQAAASPLIVVTPSEESVETIGHRMNNGVSRFLTVVVECWVKNGASPDAALDSLLSWSVQKIMADETLGGASSTIDELGTAWDAAQSDATYARADLRFRVRYHTRRTDPDTKVG